MSDTPAMNGITPDKLPPRRALAGDIFDPPAKGEEGPKPGIGIALSGGGYRAMLFHLGFLWRMHDAGILAKADRIASVSGGSITAGRLAIVWDKLQQNPQDFADLVAAPILELSRHGIDIEGGLIGRIPRLNGHWVRRAYNKYLYNHAALHSIPEHPRFVFCATSMHTGKMVRLSGQWIRDWRMGEWAVDDLQVADAVTASSAFPPVLSPFVIDTKHRAFTPWIPKQGETIYPPPEDKLFLTDGGVYDNLGLEAVWKSYDTIYVSDAGAAFQFDAEGDYMMTKQALRVTSIMQDQVGALRFRQILDAFEAKSGQAPARKGFMVASDYFLNPTPADSPPFDHDFALHLAATPTRLTELDADHARALVQWGYIATDHRIRAAGMDAGRCVVPFTP